MKKNSIDKRSKTLIIGTIIYAIGNFGTKILSFIIVPLYTYYISTGDMGDYDLLNTTVSMLSPLISLQIAEGAYVWMIRNEKKTSEYITTVYKFVIISCILASIIILIVNIIFPIQYVYYFVGILISQRIFETLQKLLRGLKNQKLFAASGIIYTALFLLLNIIQIVIFKLGVVALFQSAIISYIISIIIVLLSEKRLRQFNLNLETKVIQTKMLKYSIPLIPNQMNWWIINSSDRYMIRFFIDNNANGIYSIAYKFPSMLQLIYNIFYSAWQDMSIADNENDDDNFYSRVFEIYYTFSFSLLLFLIPATKIFIKLTMSIDYQSAAQYISFLYLGTVFQAFSSFFGVGYLKSNKTHKAAITSIYGAIVNIVINLAFIKVIGLYVVAISTFLGFLVMFIIRIFQTKDILSVKINWKKFIPLFIIALIECFIAMISNIQIDIICFIIGIFIFIYISKDRIIWLFNKLKGRFYC